jgi:hypothetical protein
VSHIIFVWCHLHVDIIILVYMFAWMKINELHQTLFLMIKVCDIILFFFSFQFGMKNSNLVIHCRKWNMPWLVCITSNVAIWKRLLVVLLRTSCDALWFDYVQESLFDKVVWHSYIDKVLWHSYTFLFNIFTSHPSVDKFIYLFIQSKNQIFILLFIASTNWWGKYQ